MRGEARAAGSGAVPPGQGGHGRTGGGTPGPGPTQGPWAAMATASSPDQPRASFRKGHRPGSDGTPFRRRRGGEEAPGRREGSGAPSQAEWSGAERRPPPPPGATGEPQL